MSENSEKERTFEKIFQENYTRLYYHAMSFLDDKEVARDIVHDVFESLWVRYDRCDFLTSITPFLYTSVRNLCIDYLRRLKSKERYSQQMLLEGEEMNDDNYLEYEELIEKLRKAVALLPEKTQAIFKKCFLEGKKYQEVADEFELSASTVKMYVMKALRELRTQFSKDQLVMCLSIFRKNR